MATSRNDWETKCSLSKVPNVNLIEKFQILFLNYIPDSVIKKLKLDLAKKENTTLGAALKFELGFYDLLTDYGIVYDRENLIEPFEAKTKKLLARFNSDSSVYPEDKIELVQIISKDIENLREETRYIKTQTERISQAYSDSRFINLFKNSGTEAILVRNTYELIFIKRTISNELNTSEFVHTSTLYPVLNLKEFKMNLPFDNGHWGYNIIIKQRNNSEVKYLFINDFHLLGLAEPYQRKSLGRILSNEITQIAIENNCYEIRGETPSAYMEDPIHMERLIGFWTDAGYAVKDHEIIKILVDEIIYLDDWRKH